MTNQKKQVTDSKEEIERISNLINEKKITVITFDTNVFRNHAYRLNSGIFAQLKEIQNYGVRLVISDVMLREMKNQLTLHLKETRTQFSTRLRSVREYISDEIPSMREWQEKIKGLSTLEVLAEKQISDFVKQSSAEVVNAESYIDLKMVLDQYFNKKEPFHIHNKKKAEFPDAIALLSLEKWSIEKNLDILAISGDSDWDSFCKKSDRFHLLKNPKSVMEILKIPESKQDIRIAKLKKEILDENSNIGTELHQSIVFLDWSRYIETKNSPFLKPSISDIFVEDVTIERVDKIVLLNDAEISATFEITANIKFEIFIVAEGSGEAGIPSIPDYFNIMHVENLVLQIGLDQTGEDLFLVTATPSPTIFDLSDIF